jgi:predicted Zn finger-like uncharacterized protein
MILTCPDCATSYFVDEGRIPPTGRRVKCTSCGRRWTAGPDGPLGEPEPALATALEPEPIPPAPQPVASEPPPAPRPARPSTPTPRRGSAGGGRALVWAGAAALAAALIAGVIVFRDQIVRVWPLSSAAYAGLGLGVDAGLVIEQVRAQPVFVEGRPALAVTGAIRNVRDAPAMAPAVRLTLLDRAGQPVAAEIARPLDAAIPARGMRYFAVKLRAPPSTARDLDVRFDAAGKAAARPSEASLDVSHG